MALWGEGDQRWIVEEREDGTNVNNWHWTEKKYTPYTIKSFNDLFLDKVLIERDGSKVIITKLKIEGDSFASNRKGKVILSYDHELEFEYKLEQEGEDHEGKIKIENFDDTNDSDELEIRVTIKKDNKETYKLKELLRLQGGEEIRKRIDVYKADFSKNAMSVILPTKSEAERKETQSPAHKSTEAKTDASGAAKNGVASKKGDEVGVKIKCSTFEHNLEFKCSAQDAYAVFMDEPRVQAWSRSALKLEPFKDGVFELFNKNVTGKFVEVVPGDKIVMDWRRNNWPAGHHSRVNLSFKEGSDSTTLTLKQTGIPTAHFKHTEDGWKNNYFRSINSVFGYGANFGEF